MTFAHCFTYYSFSYRQVWFVVPLNPKEVQGVHCFSRITTISLQTPALARSAAHARTSRKIALQRNTTANMPNLVLKKQESKDTKRWVLFRLPLLLYGCPSRSTIRSRTWKGCTVSSTRSRWGVDPSRPLTGCSACHQRSNLLCVHGVGRSLEVFYVHMYSPLLYSTVRPSNVENTHPRRTAKGP